MRSPNAKGLMSREGHVSGPPHARALRVQLHPGAPGIDGLEEVIAGRALQAGLPLHAAALAEGSARPALHAANEIHFHDGGVRRNALWGSGRPGLASVLRCIDTPE